MTLDGAWHTRGHKSLHGTGAVIDANTGLIVDYETLCKTSLVCKAKTKALEKKKIAREYYDTWKLVHVNYEGPLGGMEPAAAVRM